jgi:hypothetical protein
MESTTKMLLVEIIKAQNLVSLQPVKDTDAHET